MKMIENAIASIAPQDGSALADVESMITLHAMGASCAAAAAGVLPGVGEVIASGIGLSFTCSMYYRLCKRLGLNLRRNVIKGIASVVLAEITALLIAAVAAGTLLSFLPGVGTVGAMALASMICFLMVSTSGKLFLVILSKLFRAKTAAEIEAMSVEELRAFAKGCSTKKEVKDAMKDARADYKRVKDDEALKNQARAIRPDQETASTNA